MLTFGGVIEDVHWQVFVLILFKMYVTCIWERLVVHVCKPKATILCECVHAFHVQKNLHLRSHVVVLVMKGLCACLCSQRKTESKVTD